LNYSLRARTGHIINYYNSLLLLEPNSFFSLKTMCLAVILRKFLQHKTTTFSLGRFLNLCIDPKIPTTRSCQAVFLTKAIQYVMWYPVKALDKYFFLFGTVLNQRSRITLGSSILDDCCQEICPGGPRK